MKKILFLIYQFVPTRIRYKVAALDWLKPLRDKILRKGNSFKQVEVRIERNYDDISILFHFVASYQVAAKAVKKGVENALLRQSFWALKKRLGDDARDAVVFDVGGNFGFLSLVWATFLRTGRGKVYTVEPEPRLVSSIKKSIEVNGLEKYLEIFNLGLSDENGVIDLYTFPGGASSNPLQGHTEVLNVKTTTLDELARIKGIKRLDLLKIDVDSIEEKILRGGYQTVKKFRPIIITETNKNQSIPVWLIDLNYSLFDVHGQKVNLTELPHDIIAMPN